MQVAVSGGRRDTVNIRDTLNNSVTTALTVVLRTSTGKVFCHSTYKNQGNGLPRKPGNVREEIGPLAQCLLFKFEAVSLFSRLLQAKALYHVLFTKLF